MFAVNLDYSGCGGDATSCHDDASDQSWYFKECTMDAVEQVKSDSTSSGTDYWRMNVQEGPRTVGNIPIDNQCPPQTNPNVTPSTLGGRFDWPPYRIAAGAQQYWSGSRRNGGSNGETPLEIKRRKNREAAARCQQRKKVQLEQLRGDVKYLRDLVAQMKQEKHHLQVLDIQSAMKDNLNGPRSPA